MVLLWNRLIPLVFTVLFTFTLPARAVNDQRVALVIGNSAYKSNPLKNPANDASDMAVTLKQLGFEVILKIDADRRTMEEAILSLGRNLRKGGVGLFYFAGHGLQVKGVNYLLPVTANIHTEADVRYESVDAGRVLSQMEEAGNGLNIIVLDACRNNPFARSFRSADNGLARMDAPAGSILAFATAPGAIAADGVGRNGLYTACLLKHMRTPAIKIEEVFKRVRVDVSRESAALGQTQIPWESSSLMGDFYFSTAAGGRKIHVVPLQPAVSPLPQPPGLTASGMDDYEAVLQKRQAVMEKWATWQDAMVTEFGTADTLCQKPLLRPEEKADIWTRFLAAWGSDNPYSDRDEALRVQAEVEQRKWEAQKGQLLAMGSRPGAVVGKSFTNYVGMKFVYIKPGNFTMGSPSSEPGRVSDETQHRVTLTRGYYLQATEVTQGQWQAVMGSNPSSFKSCGDDCPVEQVSWNDVQAFIQKLNQKEGGSQYRLPTEAEWEYAARAGSDTAFANGGITENQCGLDSNLDDMGWYCGNSDVVYNGCFDLSKWGGATCAGTHPVSQKKPNSWGLYDMHGNVWEWCQDWYGDYSSGTVLDPKGPLIGFARVCRGGGWRYPAMYCRAAYRNKYSPHITNYRIGFRLARTP